MVAKVAFSAFIWLGFFHAGSCYILDLNDVLEKYIMRINDEEGGVESHGMTKQYFTEHKLKRNPVTAKVHPITYSNSSYEYILRGDGKVQCQNLATWEFTTGIEGPFEFKITTLSPMLHTDSPNTPQADTLTFDINGETKVEKPITTLHRSRKPQNNVDIYVKMCDFEVPISFSGYFAFFQKVDYEAEDLVNGGTYASIPVAKLANPDLGLVETGNGLNYTVRGKYKQEICGLPKHH